MTESIISTDPEEDDLDPALETGAATDSLEHPSWNVDADLHGMRLDRALAVRVPGFSRSWLQQLVADGQVSLNGVPCLKPSARVRLGDRLEATLSPPAHVNAFSPEAIPLKVVFEDDHLMVIDKPAGLVVHPAAGHWSGTLLNALLGHHAGAAGLPRAGIVHRLDKDTSGLMVVGKTVAACEALVRLIAAREVHRVYVALVHGDFLQASEQTIRQPIGRDPRQRLRMAVLRSGAPGARDAVTRVRRLDHGPAASWVGCKLHTGRTHQIRVHLAWLGHPLVGDALYGGQPRWGMGRQALHAHVLSFVHPVHGGRVHFNCPLPADLTHAVQAVGLNYNLDALWTLDDAPSPPDA